MVGEIISAGIGLLGGIFGGLSKNAMIKKQQAMLAEQSRQNEDWFNRRYNEDETQRTDALRLLNRTEESIKRRNKAAAGTAAVMGSTAEAVAAEKEANNQALADTASQIAAQAESRKDAIEQQYMAKKDAIADANRQLEAGKVNGWDMASAGVGAAGKVLGSIYGDK